MKVKGYKDHLHAHGDIGSDDEEVPIVKKILDFDFPKHGYEDYYEDEPSDDEVDEDKAPLDDNDE